MSKNALWRDTENLQLRRSSQNLSATQLAAIYRKYLRNFSLGGLTKRFQASASTGLSNKEHDPTLDLSSSR
jgi:hypothetical protein